jgi:RNA polymerase sigma factor (TIGR02999 family)
LIEAHQNGDSDAYDQVVALLYPDLRRLAHRQLARYHDNATMQTTAVVNEAYLKLRKSNGNAVSRDHFLGIAATTMRHVIIDYARKRMAEKRGGKHARVTLHDEDMAVAAQAEQLVLIDDALQKISEKGERMVRVFECKFFAELGDDDTASVLGMPKRTVQREWMKARGLLAEYLDQ